MSASDLTELVIMPGQDYKDICDAVRSKTGQTDLLKSGDIASAIDNIEAGDLEKFITGEITTIENDSIVKIGRGAFAYTNIQKVNLPNCTEIEPYAFYQSQNLKEIYFPKCTTMGTYSFGKPSLIEGFYFPEVISIGTSCFSESTAVYMIIPKCQTISNSCFRYCEKLQYIYAPLLETIEPYAFSECISLKEAEFEKVTTIRIYSFYGSTNLFYLTLPSTTKVTLQNSNAFLDTPFANNEGYIFVPSSLVNTYKQDSVWGNYQERIYGMEPIIINRNKNSFVEQNKSKTYVLDLKFFDSIPLVIFSNPSLCRISSHEITQSNLTFTIEGVSTGVDYIEIIATTGQQQASIEFPVEITEKLPYEVINRTSDYGFEINANNYYESNNKGINNSCAVCRVIFNFSEQTQVHFDCINYAETSYDYGLLSNLDTELTLTYSADNSSNIFKSFKESDTSSVQTVTYTIPEGEHFIDIKYIKDVSQSSNTDSLQFKIRL